MKQTILRMLQTGLNHYLSLDPQSALRMQNLSDKVVKIVMPNNTMVLQFAEGKIVFLSEVPALVDLVLTGSPLSFLRFALTKDQQIFQDDIVVEGNLELAQQIMEVFERLEIDWEEYASRWIGDVPAYQFGKLARKLRHWKTNFQEVVTRNVTDYLQEEAALVPSSEALRDFFSDVDSLRMDVDRLEAKLNWMREQRT